MGAGLRWTPELDALMVKLWNEEGLSGTQISRRPEFNVSRSAILGRVHRLKKEGVEFAHRTAGYANRVKHSRGLTAPDRIYKKKRSKKMEAKVREIETREHSVVSLEVPFSKLTPRACRYMTGDPKKGGTFCGQVTVAGKSYCRYHLGLTIHPNEGGYGTR